MTAFILQEMVRILNVGAVVVSIALLAALTARAEAASASSESRFAEAAAGGAGDANQWDLSETGMPKVEQPYKLVNKRTDGVLGYRKRPVGINLGWVASSEPQWTLHRETATDKEPVREGESVALRNATGGYVYDAPRGFGINLNWSTTPKYEWRVSKSGELFSLRNEVARDDLVYDRRLIGVNLCWLRDVTIKGICVPN